MPNFVGRRPHQIPLNAHLGELAFLGRRSLSLLPPASVAPTELGQLVIEATSNTTVTLKLMGTDGVVRSVALTLA